MTTIFPFDELENLRTKIEAHFTMEGPDGAKKPKPTIKSREDVEDMIDEMFDFYLLAYASGVNAINEQFNADFEPTAEEIEQTIYMPIKNETWVDRVWKWYEKGGTVEDIMRIAETEAHRDANAAANATAIKAGATTKRWGTMLDDKVRDTHYYLEGMTVPIDARFYTYDNDSARFPGDFTLPQNNANCRCELSYN